ncbi:maleylpyruvate isomerase N-terminal domain-containing protein [Nonomuraea sp. LPB2021202275-12-8]|uniref:maleylpyruvate isomerase N-terminal domain-containing protein n=1 Tax=Nonomuraea sp. LPB2021202275-12-8 TaxID=3120159 RepID=UPI00300C208F
MNGETILRTADECRAFLLPLTEQDWTTTPIPEMDWTVAQAVAHISDVLMWFSADFAAGDLELSTMELRVRPESTPVDLVATMSTVATVLARVVDGAPAGARGWHPMGLADASGFAAMACDEMLVHTADASRGVGRDFVPSEQLSDATLRRLFPWAPTDTDPWTALLWANGRADLPGQERQVGWSWHCAPLAEWDGVNPTKRQEAP